MQAAYQVKPAGVRMLVQRPGLIVEVVKESSSENGVIAYSSKAPGPQKDLPDNINLVHDTYSTPLSGEHYLCPSTVEDGLEVLAKGLVVE